MSCNSPRAGASVETAIITLACAASRAFPPIGPAVGAGIDLEKVAILSCLLYDAYDIDLVAGTFEQQAPRGVSENMKYRLSMARRMRVCDDRPLRNFASSLDRNSSSDQLSKHSLSNI